MAEPKVISDIRALQEALNNIDYSELKDLINLTDSHVLTNTTKIDFLQTSVNNLSSQSAIKRVQHLSGNIYFSSGVRDATVAIPIPVNVNKTFVILNSGTLLSSIAYTMGNLLTPILSNSNTLTLQNNNYSNTDPRSYSYSAQIIEFN